MRKAFQGEINARGPPMTCGLYCSNNTIQLRVAIENIDNLLQCLAVYSSISGNPAYTLHNPCIYHIFILSICFSWWESSATSLYFSVFLWSSPQFANFALGTAHCRQFFVGIELLSCIPLFPGRPIPDCSLIFCRCM